MPRTSSCVESDLEFGSPGLSTALQTRHTAAQPLTLPLQPLATLWNVCPSQPQDGPAARLWFLLLAISILSNSPPTSTKHTHIHTQTYTRWILLFISGLCTGLPLPRVDMNGLFTSQEICSSPPCPPVFSTVTSQTACHSLKDDLLQTHQWAYHFVISIHIFSCQAAAVARGIFHCSTQAPL